MKLWYAFQAKTEKAGPDRVKGFPQGTHMVQNFILNPSTTPYSITIEISKYINSKESNGSLKTFQSIKAQSYIHSYSFIL